MFAARVNVEPGSEAYRAESEAVFAYEPRNLATPASER